MRTFQCSTLPADASQECLPEIELAKLKYIGVRIDGVTEIVNGLADSGAELSICHSDVVRELNVVPFGHVLLRGILGQPVDAQLIKLSIKSPDSDEEYFSIVCAMCDQLNDNLILTQDIAMRLITSQNKRLVDSLEVKREPICATAIVDNNPSVNSESSNLQSESAISESDNLSSDLRKASVDVLRQEQLLDTELRGCWTLAKRGKGNYFVKDDLLYRWEVVTGQRMEMLVVPSTRYKQVLELAHSSMFGGHMAVLKTCERIRLSGLTWPTLRSTCKDYISKCEVCQKRARITCYDRVPISSIPRGEETFSHWFIDCFGPLFPNQSNVQYNYGLLCIDAASRWPTAFPLRSLTAKSVCEALLQLFMQTG
jgi:hypothetical protein